MMEMETEQARKKAQYQDQLARQRWEIIVKLVVF